MRLEQWRDIVWTDGRYEVSDLGRVRCAGYTRMRKNGTVTTIRPRVLKSTRRPDGRYKVALGRGVQRLVHRLVAEAFIGPPPTPLHEVNHKNGDPSDNRVENLEWVTTAENLRHARATGLNQNHGERSRQAKLTDSAVLEVRCLLAAGMSQRAIAARIGVHQSQISRIARGTAWRRTA